MIQQLINGIALGAVYALIAVGFALIFNVLKFSNFSHSGVLVVTAYFGYIISTKFQLNFVLTLIITAIFGGFLAVAIEFLGFKKLRKNNSPLIFYFVSSITIGMLLENFMTIMFSSNFYSYPSFFKTTTIKVAELTIAVTDLLMLIISLSALFILMFIIQKTKLGIAIRALSMDVNTTGLMGVNTNLIIMATFFTSGFFGGLSGVFLGLNYTLYPQLGQMIVKGFIASVVGGLGNINGAIIGAFILGILEVLLIGVPGIGSGLSPVIIFFVMLVFLILRPQGISGIIVTEKA